MHNSLGIAKPASCSPRRYKCMLVLLACAIALLMVQGEPSAQATTQPGIPKFKGAWTDADDKKLPEDFKFQGEYIGQFASGDKLGAQVISLGKDAFQAVLLPGGLPGDGWDRKNKILIDGKREGGKATFTSPAGKRKYDAVKAEEFTATFVFPPPGQKNCTASIVGGVFQGTIEGGQSFKLTKTIRTSPAQGLKPPAGALVLFDGANTDNIKGGRWNKERGTIYTDGKDISSKRTFMNFSVHVEFMSAYKPDARGQNRGNSGVYLVNQYEIQILDSFGLNGQKNECGSIYNKLPPATNMCYPPLQWQTYDIDFTNAVQDGQGKKIKNARATVKHNGVLVQDNAEITGKTGVNSRKDAEGTPGVLLLQGHNNPTQFRNVWLVDKSTQKGPK